MGCDLLTLSGKIDLSGNAFFDGFPRRRLLGQDRSGPIVDQFQEPRGRGSDLMVKPTQFGHDVGGQGLPIRLRCGRGLQQRLGQFAITALVGMLQRGAPSLLLLFQQLQL